MKKVLKFSIRQVCKPPASLSLDRYTFRIVHKHSKQGQSRTNPLTDNRVCFKHILNMHSKRCEIILLLRNRYFPLSFMDTYTVKVFFSKLSLMLNKKEDRGCKSLDKLVPFTHACKTCRRARKKDTGLAMSRGGRNKLRKYVLRRHIAISSVSINKEELFAEASIKVRYKRFHSLPETFVDKIFYTVFLDFYENFLRIKFLSS